MLKVYPSTLPGEPIETHDMGGASLGEWLQARYPKYQPGDQQPFIATSGGRVVPPTEWGNLRGEVELRFAAQGEVVVSYLINAIISIAASYAISLLFGGGGGGRGPQDRAQARKLDPAEARANTPRLGEVIPEGGGRYIRYPDYLLPPRRYFESKTEQSMEMLLCVGKGKYLLEEMKIGDSLMDSLGTEYTQYQPGADLSAETAAEWWHTAPEVGSTSKGTAGLELRAPYEPDPASTATEYEFDEFTIDATAGQFPATWAEGMTVRVVSPVDWTVVDGGFETRDIIQGDMTELAPFVGMLVEIAGDNEGQYQIHSYTAPDEITLNRWDESILSWVAVEDLATGTRSMSIGYKGLLYRVTEASISQLTVGRLTDTGAADIGWPGFTTITTTSATITAYQASILGEWVGPFAVCPPGKTSASLEYDFFFPAGLCSLGTGGEVNAKSATVEVQYRAVGGTTWTSIIHTYTERTLDQIGFTESLAVSDTAWEMRARRIGAPSTLANEQDTIQWYGLRAKIDAPTSYAGVTVLSVKMTGGNKISAQAEQMINCVATRILPYRSGGAWQAEAPTRKISAFVAHIAKSIGYTDAQLDLDELDRLEAIWTARGDTFDYFFSETTVRDAINQCLRPGYAEMTVDRGRIRPVRDELLSEAMQSAGHVYTPQNMTKTLTRSFQAARPEDPDGVEVEYTDSETWTKETVQCLLPGDAGVKLEKTRLDGVVDRTRAWRIGMRRRRELRYRRWRMEFATELDALNSRYLGFAYLGDDVPGYGQSAILIDYQQEDATVRLQVSEPLTWEDGPHYVLFRNPDGTGNGPYLATPGADEYEILAPVLNLPDLEARQEPPHVLFGPAATWHFPALITEIRPNGLDDVTVAAANYDARVYADDNNSPGA